VADDPADATVPNAGLFFSSRVVRSRDRLAGLLRRCGLSDGTAVTGDRHQRDDVTIADGLAHPSYLWQSALNPRAGWLKQSQLIHDSGLENLASLAPVRGRHQCDIGVAWGHNIWVRGVGMTPHYTGWHQGGAVDFGFIAIDSNHVSFVNNWMRQMIGGGIRHHDVLRSGFQRDALFRVENNVFNNV